MSGMHERHVTIAMSALGLFLLLGACATPHSFPEGLTPIPTLVPATEPASVVGATEAPSFTIQSYPAGLPSVERGKPLYDNHCASCHGEDGNGVVPGARNFGDLDYMRGETPAFFYSAITEGRSEMPSFQDRLTSDERWDVVFYVWRFSTNAQSLGLGGQIYGANCAACHGVDGTGEVLGSADFTDLRQIDGLAPRDFYLTVTQGSGSMPAWQGRLSQDERWAVIDYLRTFSYDPGVSVGGAASASSPPSPAEEELVCDAYVSQSNPFAWDDADAVIAGQIIYEESCAMCHGADGSGGLPNTPDFTSSGAQSELVENSGEALCIVAEGRESMPGWKETLSTEQMWQVLIFMANLGE
jgi:mono/diheme cytochrome c family protein